MLYLKQITGNGAFQYSVGQGHSAGFFGDRCSRICRIRWCKRAGTFAAKFYAAVMALVCSFILVKRGAGRSDSSPGLDRCTHVISPLQSLARYVMVVFPVFIVLFGGDRAPRVDQTIRAFIGLLPEGFVGSA